MDSSPAKQRTDGKCLRVGIIGTGGIAHGHARGYLAAKGAQLVALCDIDGARLEAFAKQYGVDAPRCYRDYRELLACPDIDAVDICTPNDVHVPVALAAVEAGKAISCEKPVSVDAPTVLRLKDAVAARQLPAAVCFSYRYRQAAIRARELIRSGALGTIRHVYVQYLQSWGNPEKKCPCVWRFKEKASGSGALGDLGIHMIDERNAPFFREVSLLAQIGRALECSIGHCLDWLHIIVFGPVIISEKIQVDQRPSF